MGTRGEERRGGRAHGDGVNDEAGSGDGEVLSWYGRVRRDLDVVDEAVGKEQKVSGREERGAGRGDGGERLDSHSVS